MTNTTAVRCQNLSRSYGDVQALQALDLAVPAGSIFGFLGRNGAGKTTTIRLLTGLARPTAGQAWVAGVETTNGDSRARELFGYLPQDPAFYSWMTAREYLDYVAKLFRMEKAARRARIDELLELVALTDAANRRIGGFSGGMKQRLGLAQALVNRPPVLFLDEPTSALDPAGRYAVLEMIERLRGDVTVFLSSHILADVERVCDTIGIIHHGRLLLVAGRDELLSQYAANIVELELDGPSRTRAAEFAAELGRAAWVAGVTHEANRLRVTVTDRAAAQADLLPCVVASGLTLTRYEWTRPSLEEVFLRLSEEKDEG